MIDVRRFLDDRDIEYRESGKNVASNDINICCPFCGEDRFHLGIHKKLGLLNCWVCGFDEMNYKPRMVDLVVEFDNVSRAQAYNTLKEYSDDFDLDFVKREKETADKTVLPEGAIPFSAVSVIQRQAKGYLLKRGFDDSTIKKYNLMYTISGDYSYRIIVPIYFDNVLVSFLGRDFTNKQELRYKNCRLYEAVKANKDILYGWDFFISRVCKTGENHLRVVEGCTDVWRFGDSSLGLLTNKMSPVQRNLIVSLRLKSLSIFLDPGSYSKCLEIAEELSPFIGEIKIPQMKGNKDVAERSLDELLELEANAKLYRD